MAEDSAEAAASEPAPTDPPPVIPTAKAGTLAAIIRNGLSNGPIAQSPATWDHLNTRLGEIVAALMKEI
jgi:hypothetical protein